VAQVYALADAIGPRYRALILLATGCLPLLLSAWPVLTVTTCGTPETSSSPSAASPVPNRTSH
jgi:hypothetical protein